jgi:hypothetical protein
MNRYPVKAKMRSVRAAHPEVIEATPSRVEHGPFTSFRYAYTEVSIVGGKARVHSRRTQLEDGKLSSESFDGEVERTAYDRMVADAQRQFIAHTGLMLASLAAWLPAPWKRTSGRN